MDRHFLVPVSIAAALHAGLLWVPGTPAKNSVVAPAATTLVDAFEFLHPVELTPPEPTRDEVASPASASSAAPTLPELLENPTLKDFLVAAAEVTPTVVPHPISTLPSEPAGPAGIDLGGFRPGPGAVIGIGDLDNTPRARSSPVYPFEAKRDGREGRVTVEFMVDESGAVVSPHVVESTDRIFHDAALRAVAKWRFAPGRREGRAVRFRMAVPILFTLRRG